MSQTLNVRVNLSKILKDKVYQGKTGKFIDLNIYVNDEPSQYGDNVSIALAQTKEEREAKTPRQYIGNGKTLDLMLAQRNQEQGSTAPTRVVAEVDEDLPF